MPGILSLQIMLSLQIIIILLVFEDDNTNADWFYILYILRMIKTIDEATIVQFYPRTDVMANCDHQRILKCCTIVLLVILIPNFMMDSTQGIDILWQ